MLGRFDGGGGGVVGIGVGGVLGVGVGVGGYQTGGGECRKVRHAKTACLLVNYPLFSSFRSFYPGFIFAVELL